LWSQNKRGGGGDGLRGGYGGAKGGEWEGGGGGRGMVGRYGCEGKVEKEGGEI